MELFYMIWSLILGMALFTFGVVIGYGMKPIKHERHNVTPQIVMPPSEVAHEPQHPIPPIDAPLTALDMRVRQKAAEHKARWDVLPVATGVMPTVKAWQCTEPIERQR